MFELDGGWGVPTEQFRGVWRELVLQGEGHRTPAKSSEALGGSRGHLLGFAYAGALVPRGDGSRAATFRVPAPPQALGCSFAALSCHLARPRQVSALECSLCSVPPKPWAATRGTAHVSSDVPLPQCLLPSVSSLGASLASNTSQPHPSHGSAAQRWLMAAAQGEP